MHPLPRVNGKTAARIAVLLLLSGSPLAGQELPIVGKFTQNVACIGDGSANKDFLVTITPTRIDSSMAICTISNIRRAEQKFTLQTSCKSGGNDLFTGDVIMTIIDETRIDVEDADQAFTSVLYRCRE